MQENIFLMSQQVADMYWNILEGQEGNINVQLKLITEGISNLMKSKKSGASSQTLFPHYENIINNSFIACQYGVSSALGSNIRSIQQDLLKDFSGIANLAVVFETNSSNPSFDSSPHIKNFLVQLKQIKLTLAKQSNPELLSDKQIFEESLKDLLKFKFFQGELSCPANNLQGDLMGLSNKIIESFQNFFQKFDDKMKLFASFDEVNSCVTKLSSLITRTLKFNKDPSLLNRLTAYNDSLLFHLRYLKLCLIQSSYSFFSSSPTRNFGRAIAGCLDLIMQIIECVYFKMKKN